MSCRQRQFTWIDRKRLLNLRDHPWECLYRLQRTDCAAATALAFDSHQYKDRTKQPTGNEAEPNEESRRRLTPREAVFVVQQFAAGVPWAWPIGWYSKSQDELRGVSVCPEAEVDLCLPREGTRLEVDLNRRSGVRAPEGTGALNL
jgi:hypothetical protein